MSDDKPNGHHGLEMRLQHVESALRADDSRIARVAGDLENLSVRVNRQGDITVQTEALATEVRRTGRKVDKLNEELSAKIEALSEVIMLLKGSLVTEPEEGV